MSSPAKKRHDALSNSLPVSRSRRKIRAPPALAVSATVSPIKLEISNTNHPTHLYTMHSVNGLPPNVPTIPITALPDMASSMEILAQEAHMHNLQRQEDQVSGTGTEAAYTRQLKAYIKWWDEDQAHREHVAAESGGLYCVVPAHPITVTKVVVYMSYELTRPKKLRGADISGSRVGVSAIKQAISALENYRHNHQRDTIYQNCPESHIPLRSSADINLIERSAQASEPQRQTESQEMKKNGTTSQTFSEQELIRISMLFFGKSYSRTCKDIYLGMRDRAMLLFSTSMMFRGDDTRSILVSDLHLKDIRMPDIGLDVSFKALLVFSDQGKTNKTGRVDLIATFRHRKEELCAIGALACYMFAKYHVMNQSRPEFAPDYTDSRGGSSGYRHWYDLFLFPGQDPYEEMTPENHRKRFNHVKLLSNIFFRKVNHAGRPFAATAAVENGASPESVKAVGLWSTPGSFACYNRAMPIDAMVALAGFNGRQLESYFVPRELLVPPETLMSVVFSWIEEEEHSLEDRKKRLGLDGQDAALESVLLLFRFLRTVLIQDAAILYARNPSFFLFQHAPFNTAEFRAFSFQSTAVIENAESSSRERLRNLPEKIAASIRSAMELSVMRQEQTINDIQEANTQANIRMDSLQEVLHSSLRIIGSVNPRKRKEIDEVIETQSVVATNFRRVFSGTNLHDAHRLEHYSPSPAARVPVVAPSQPMVEATEPERHLHATFVSGNGNVYSIRTFPMESHPAELYSRQMIALTELETRIPPSTLKHHTFEWDTKHGDWLPYFEGFWKPRQGHATLQDIWREYESGIGELMSITQLTKVWGARWKRDLGKLKTESSRRNKVVDLINRIAVQNGWDGKKVLDHLEEVYPLTVSSVLPYLKSTRTFIEHLQKDKHAADNIVASSIDYI